MKKIGILGLGKMGSSILNGLISSSSFSEDEIIIYDRNIEKVEKYQNIKSAISVNDLYDNCSTIILAIKPQSFPITLSSLNTKNNAPIIVSIAAGINIKYLESKFKNQKIVRVMPTLTASINKSITSIAINDKVDEADLDFILKIFSSIGESLLVKEEEIDKLVPISGSFPAFLYYFLNEFVRASIYNGLDEKMAIDTIIKTTYASLDLYKNENLSFDDLIKDICSPNGVTIEGINTLKSYFLDQAINELFTSCVNRSIELSKIN